MELVLVCLSTAQASEIDRSTIRCQRHAVKRNSARIPEKNIVNQAMIGKISG